MKRLLSALILIPLSLTMLCISAGAEDQTLSMKYVPRTQRGTLFYIDVYSDSPVSAALFELAYDPDIAEFRTVFCDDDSASAMGVADCGRAKIAYARSAGVNGKLFRIAFKALKTGKIDFALSVTQATDSDLRFLTDIPTARLRVSLGKNDVVCGRGSVKTSAGKTTGEKSGKRSFGGSGSDISRSCSDDQKEQSEPDDKGLFGDLGGQDKQTYFVWGAAAAIFAGLLVVAGIMIGRRTKKKSPKTDDDPPADGEDEEEE